MRKLIEVGTQLGELSCPLQAPTPTLPRNGEGRTECYVARERVGEKERFLEHAPDLRAEPFEREVAHIDAVEKNASLDRIVEPK